MVSREKDGHLSRKACREKVGQQSSMVSESRMVLEETVARSRIVSKAGWPANRIAGREVWSAEQDG
jgi:hypothetical protein